MQNKYKRSGSSSIFPINKPFIIIGTQKRQHPRFWVTVCFANNHLCRDPRNKEHSIESQPHTPLLSFTFYTRIWNFSPMQCVTKRRKIPKIVNNSNNNDTWSSSLIWNDREEDRLRLLRAKGWVELSWFFQSFFLLQFW